MYAKYVAKIIVVPSNEEIRTMLRAQKDVLGPVYQSVLSDVLACNPEDIVFGISSVVDVVGCKPPTYDVVVTVQEDHWPENGADAICGAMLGPFETATARHSHFYPTVTVFKAAMVSAKLKG